MTRIFWNPSTLKCVPLFSSLTDGELAALLPCMQHRTYPAHSTLIRAGENADGLFVIVSGRVKILLEDGEGREIILAVLGANDFVGEIGLIDASPHFASVQAQQACEILFVPRKAVLDWLARDPAAALSMLRTVTERLADAQRKIGNLALVDVYGRVAQVILETARDVNGQLLVEVGSEQMAATVGASREMVSRVVKQMITNGIVRRFKRKLIVLDRASLVEHTARCRTSLRGARSAGFTGSTRATSQAHS